MVRFLSSVLQQQQQEGPQSPKASKKTTRSSNPSSPMAAKSPPALMEHSPDSSFNSSPASSRSLRLVFPFAARNRLLTEDALMVRELHIADTCSTDDKSECDDSHDNNHCSQDLEGNDDDIHVPHLTMTHENPFKSSNSPCPPMQRKHSLSERNVTIQQTEPREEKEEDESSDDQASEVSSISNDSRKRYAQAAMAAAAQPQQALHVVEDSAAAPQGAPPPMEISIPTKCVPTPQWLRMEDEHTSSCSSGLSSLLLTPPSAPSSPVKRRGHRRSFSAGLPLPPLTNNLGAALAPVVQPSRSMARPTLRKHQSAPTTALRRLRHSMKTKENVISSPSNTSTTISVSQMDIHASGLGTPPLATWLEQEIQGTDCSRSGSHGAYYHQDSIVGNRPRRCDPLPPRNTVMVGSIVGQSSLTATQSSTSSGARGGDEPATLEATAEATASHRRRKSKASSTLTMFSLGLTSPVRRLVQPSDPNAKSKVDLRRSSNGCLT